MYILRTADVMRRYFDTLLEPYGLTGQQYNVLRILRGATSEGLQTMEIAGRMMEKTPGITGLIDRLEQKSLIERRRCDKDRRCVYCAITREGLELLAELDGPIEQADEQLMARVTNKEAGELVRMLRAIHGDE